MDWRRLRKAPGLRKDVGKIERFRTERQARELRRREGAGVAVASP